MANSVRIGNTNVLHSSTLILSDDETAFIEIPLPLNAPIATDTVRLGFKCVNSGDTHFSWASSDNMVSFTLAGMKPENGVFTTPAPVRFGEQNGRALLIDFAYWRISNRNVIALSISQGGAQS